MSRNKTTLRRKESEICQSRSSAPACPMVARPERTVDARIAAPSRTSMTRLRSRDVKKFGQSFLGTPQTRFIACCPA
jgi:hypothetical protein